MRNKYYFSLFMCFFAWMMFNGVTSSAGKSGKSGAPGENTCIQCHSTNALNDPTGSITVNVAGVTNGQYTAGQTYQVSVTIAKAGQSLFGFSAVALDASGQNAGTLTAGADNHTEMSSASGTNRNYVTHNANGGLASNQKTFTFSWTAPTSGSVNFYFTGLAANNNGGTSGDFVYSSTLTLAPATMGGGTVVINEVDCDQAGPDTQEFVELYGTPNMSLNGYTIVFFNGNNSLAYSSFDLDGYSLDANGFFVLGNPMVPNVDMIFDHGASGFLQNGPDAVALYLADATSWPVDAPVSATGLVDAIVYGTADPDATGLLTVLTPGQLQVNETAGNIPECLARVPDGGTPLVVTSYVQQLPTPGTSNSTTVVAGCMNVNACNYNSAATVDDNSCLYTGATCDDGNPNSTGDAIDASCNCVGQVTQVNVTFQVDMNTSTVAASGVFLQGDFQNWQTNPDIPMTDGDADGVYTVTVVLPSNSPFQYKFLNGTGGWEVTPALAACGTPDLVNVDGYNRADTTTNVDLILPVVCFGSCYACPTSSSGCMIPNACNYDPTATINDIASCVFATTWYLDADADGYYASSTSACSNPGSGYTATQGINGDCNDAVASINAGATEVCGNGIDENCDGIDEICTGTPGCTDMMACNYDPSATQNNGSCTYEIIWYLDADADGYYVSSQSACTNPGAGYTATMGIDGDCDDGSASINAAASEICGDGIDQNCDGFDDACAIPGCMDVTACNYEPAATQDDGSCFFATDWYLDLDLDGYASEVLNACASPGVDYTSSVLPLNDCDDTDASINPGATDICENGVDEDCSGDDASCTLEGCMDATACNYDANATVDDGSCTYSTAWYLDADEDGYYTITVQSCDSPGATFNNVGGIQGDCNDNNAGINAGAQEICGNEVDENCDGTIADCPAGCPNPVIISIDSIANLECFGIPTGFIGTSVTGGSGLYYAQWNTNPIQTTPFASNLPAGFHTLIVLDTEGCADTVTVEITQPDGSFPVVLGNNDTAPAESAQYTVNSYPGATYTWTVSGGVIVSGQGTETINVVWNDVNFGNVTVVQNDNGCELSDGITIFVNGVGVDEAIEGLWSVYPNPAREQVTLQSSLSQWSWEIVEMNGRKVMSGNSTSSSMTLDISNCAPGLYLVRTTEGIEKLIIE